MTGHDDLDRTLAGWFEADALPPAPGGGLDRVIDATRHRKPRPAWIAGPGSHWVGGVPDPASRTGAGALPRLGARWSIAMIVVLVTAAMVGGAILVGALLFHPSPVPTGRLGDLAYGLDGDVFVADWDGANPVRIADGVPDVNPTAGQSFWGYGPIWSPDGRHLAYRSGGGLDACCGTIYISDPAGHVVASFPGTGWLVSWSPDSSRVATWVELGRTIGIYGVDGVRHALLTVPPGCPLPGDFDPVWSPDGMSLVIATCGVPLDGGVPRPARSADPRSHPETSYSSDGARLAFIAYPDSRSLVIAKADGTKLRVLPGAVIAYSGTEHGPEYQNPMMSPTGDRVAFIWSPTSVVDQTADPSSTIYELRVVDVARGKVTTLATGNGNDGLRVIRFSPEGDRILYSTSDLSGVGSTLRSVKVDGSNPQLLVTGTTWGDWQVVPAGR